MPLLLIAKRNGVAEYLYAKHKIFTVVNNRTSVKGVRVTLHLYTTKAELDLLVTAIQELSKAQIGAC